MAPSVRLSISRAVVPRRPPLPMPTASAPLRGAAMLLNTIFISPSPPYVRRRAGAFERPAS